MKKLVILILLFLLLIFPEAMAGVGIGMGPTSLSILTSTGTPYSTRIIIYNPGDYDIKARVTFDCKNCEYDAYLLGFKIGKIREDYRQFFRFEPEEVYIANHTGPENAIPVTVHVTPSLWVKKELVFSTPEAINFLVRLVNPSYTGEFAIPYSELLVDEKHLEGGITVSAFWSTFGAMGATPAVGAPLDLRIRGIPFGSLLIIISFILIVIIALILKFRKSILGLIKRK